MICFQGKASLLHSHSIVTVNGYFSSLTVLISSLSGFTGVTSTLAEKLSTDLMSTLMTNIFFED